jgi:hypothetical protein
MAEDLNNLHPKPRAANAVKPVSDADADAQASGTPLVQNPAIKNNAPETAANIDRALAEKAPKKHKRTLGLKLFDVGLYPILSNAAVIAVSIVATFLTARGGDTKNGKLIYGKTGKWFQKRGDTIESWFQRKGASQKNAEMGKIVFFSFLDGSIMAPLVKLLEDRREKISLWIDEKLGTKPDDMSVYAAEPKQSWGSVLGGRALTAGIVVPVAIVLSRPAFLKSIKNGVEGISWAKKGEKGNKSLNDILFNDPSVRHLEKAPRIKSWLNNVIKKITGVTGDADIAVPVVKNGTVTKIAAKQGDTAFGTFARMTYFETFYASVCTGGLYLTSRLLARIFGKRKEEKNAKNANADDSAPLPAKKTVSTDDSATIKQDHGEATPTEISSKTVDQKQPDNFSKREQMRAQQVGEEASLQL